MPFVQEIFRVHVAVATDYGTLSYATEGHGTASDALLEATQWVADEGANGGTVVTSATLERHQVEQCSDVPFRISTEDVTDFITSITPYVAGSVWPLTLLLRLVLLERLAAAGADTPQAVTLT